MEYTPSSQEPKHQSDISSVIKLTTLLHIYASHQLTDLVSTIRQQQRDQMVRLVRDLLPDDDTARTFLARLDGGDGGVEELAQLVNTAV
jgi:hypothetical protein